MKIHDNKITIGLLIAAILFLTLCILSMCCALSLFAIFNYSGLSENSDRLTSRSPQTIAVHEEINQAEYLQIVIDTVKEIRGIETAQAFTPLYQTQEDLRTYLTTKLADKLTGQEIVDEQDLMLLLGFIEPEMNLKEFYLDFYTSQVAGFFDEEQNEIVLIENASTVENALTVAHEYTHLLQFNAFNIQDALGYNDENCAINAEYCLALNAIIEGDATLTELLTENELNLRSLIAQTNTNGTDTFSNAPRYFQNWLSFPYHYGFEFVVEAYSNGGFDVVNKLYENPPLSAEQIMHPEKYAVDEPVNVSIATLRKILDQRCELAYDNVFNEADILWFFNSASEESWRLSDAEAAEAASGWGGGAFQFARCENQPLFLSKIVWDTQKDTLEFTEAFHKYAEKRWGKQTDEHYEANGERAYMIDQNKAIYLLIAPFDYDPAELFDAIQQSN